MKLTPERKKQIIELMDKIYDESAGLVSCAGDAKIEICLEMSMIKDMKTRVKYLSKLITELNRRFYKEDEEYIDI